MLGLVFDILACGALDTIKFPSRLVAQKPGVLAMLNIRCSMDVLIVVVLSSCPTCTTFAECGLCCVRLAYPIVRLLRLTSTDVRTAGQSSWGIVLM
jgi:hypothetical protein